MEEVSVRKMPMQNKKTKQKWVDILRVFELLDVIVVVFQGTLPVFIKQVYKQKDDLVKMWGFEYKMITTVAIVRNIDHSSTKITYALEDLTGKKFIQHWNLLKRILI